MGELKSCKDYADDEMAVRVLGRLKTVHLQTNSVEIEYQNECLSVDIALLMGQHKQNFKTGVLFQFIGELEQTGDEPCLLKARVCRDMTGLDTDMFDRCLQIRRDLEKTLFEKMDAA